MIHCRILGLTFHPVVMAHSGKKIANGTACLIHLPDWVGISMLKISKLSIVFTGHLGEVIVLDLSPSGQLYQEKFITVGEQALESEFFK